MKALKIITVLLSCALFSMSLQAQQKIGYVDSTTIIALLPVTRTADEEIRALNASFEAEAKGKMDELNAKFEEMTKQQEAGLLTAEMETAGSAVLNQLQQDIEGIREQARKQIEERRAVLMRPIMNTVQEAIDAISEQEGYSMVFDRRESGLVFSDQELDITVLVLSSLGVEPPAAPAETE